MLLVRLRASCWQRWRPRPRAQLQLQLGLHSRKGQLSSESSLTPLTAIAKAVYPWPGAAGVVGPVAAVGWSDRAVQSVACVSTRLALARACAADLHVGSLLVHRRHHRYGRGWSCSPFSSSPSSHLDSGSQAQAQAEPMASRELDNAGGPLLIRHAYEHLSSVAVVEPDGTQLTYASLLRDSKRLAGRLQFLTKSQSAGDLQQKRVAFLCPRDYTYPLAQWAIWRYWK